MSNSNGMYNVLNVFKKLTPLNESTAKEVAKDIYDEVEAKGSILEGVSKVEKKLREEYETLKTKQGTIHKVSRYGNDYDVGDDGTSKPKAKHVPKTGQKGRPKKEQPASFDAPKGDIFGRTTGKAPKGKGTVVKGKDTYDTVDEGEVVAVKGGKVHKGHYGYETDVNDDGTKKTKHAPKTGQKGRPKKEQPASYNSPKGDIFGRTTGAVPKSKKGTVVHGKANQDTINESRDHTSSEYTYEVVGRRLAAEKPHVDTNSDLFFDAVYDEMVEIGITPRAARNKLNFDEDFLGDVASSYAHFCKTVDEAVVRPEDIPAVQRKAAGQNFPVTTQQLDAPGDNISDPRNLSANNGTSQELDELARLAGLTMESKQVKENIAFGDAASDMQQQQGKINVNTNASSDGSKNINISADGDAAEMLLQMLKMAGLGGGEAAAHAQEVMTSGSGVEVCDEPIEIEMDEAEDQYANTPEECYQGQDVITHQGDDMNREKKQFKREYPGDNPMAVENIDVVTHMGRDLMAEYQAMKLQK
jgi:hypothetical protein